MRRSHRILIICALLLIGLRAKAQELSLQVESEDLYANLPFVLTVVAQGFDEEPQPRLSPLTIPGCKITPLPVVPNVSSMVQIINGQRSEHRRVSFAYRFRIEVARPGAYAVPALSAEQGSKRAQSRSARFTVRSLEETGDMKVRLTLPDRPLWTGETVDGALEWYLRREVGNRTFVVPLFDQEGLEIAPMPTAGSDGRLGGFAAGTRTLELPYRRDRATLDGEEYTRFRFLFRLTASRAGIVSAPPPRVVAALTAGYARDVFGFQVPQERLFQAIGKAVKLEVRPLPLTNRPGSFSGAVGGAFSIDVQAQRTVVRVGDPVELRILLRGDGRLAGIALPDLYKAGLPEAHFTVPDEPPVGEMQDDEKGKLFRVSVRLRDTKATQVPPLSFGYFAPDKGTYEVARSQPIALQVQGSAVVTAGDVVGAAPTKSAAAGARGESKVADASPLSLVGADLALSEEGRSFRRAPSARAVAPLLGLLYGAPLLLVVGLWLRQRGQAGRGARAEVRAATRRGTALVNEAAEMPAREAAPRLLAALRAIAGTEDRRRYQPLIEKLETIGYGPDAGRLPLPKDVLEEARGAFQDHERQQTAARPGDGGHATKLLILLGLALARTAAADVPDPRLAAARAAYGQALGQTDPDVRREGFVQAMRRYRELTEAYPDRPELLCDFGNAALLSYEPGWAVLGYRRALHLDPTLSRARRNLAFARGRVADVPPWRGGGALDTLFFWQGWLTPAGRHLLAALAFAVAVLLLAPVGGPAGRRLRRGLALAPFLLCLLMLASREAGRAAPGEAVVVSGEVLRAADSEGAPPAYGRPVPAGAEVLLQEDRGAWARVELGGGATGWLHRGSLALIAPR